MYKGRTESLGATDIDGKGLHILNSALSEIHMGPGSSIVCIQCIQCITGVEGIKRTQ
jgi:hypothetical protein